MKLRNKKTGEISEVNFLPHGATLAELNAEWEDYEDQDEYWYINSNGDVDSCMKIDRLDEPAKEIGNYFEAKKEAEKAVGKLKAWKRLRDNGLKITGYGKYAYDPKSTHHINIALDYVSDEDRKDLDLLFSPEVKNNG